MIICSFRLLFINRFYNNLRVFGGKSLNIEFNFFWVQLLVNLQNLCNGIIFFRLLPFKYLRLQNAIITAIYYSGFYIIPEFNIFIIRPGCLINNLRFLQLAAFI